MHFSAFEFFVLLSSGLISGALTDPIEDFCYQEYLALHSGAHANAGESDGANPTTITCPPRSTTSTTLTQPTAEQQITLSINEDSPSQTVPLRTPAPTTCAPYPSDLNMSLSLSLLAYQQALSTLSITTSFTLPLSASGSSSWTLKTSPSLPLDSPATQTSPLFVNVPDVTTTSSLVTSDQVTPSPVTLVATCKRGLLHDRRQAMTFQPLSLQPSSTDSNLHREPEPTVDSKTDNSGPSASSTPSDSPIQPSSKKSGAVMAKKPPMAFLVLCALLALSFASPSFAANATGSTPTPTSIAVTSVPLGTAIPSRCADNPSSLCLGSATVGGFAPPPTALSSAPALLSSLSNSASLASSSSVSDLVSSLTTVKTTPAKFAHESSTSAASSSLSTATVILTAPGTTEDHTITYTTQSPDSAAGSTSSDSPSQTLPIDGSSSLDITSTITSTTTNPPSTTVSTSVVTPTVKVPTLQNAGTLSKRSPLMILFIYRLLAVIPTALAEWKTKSPSPMETYCADLHAECFGGTPVSINVLEAGKTTISDPKKVLVTPTPCPEDPEDGCISSTPVSQLWSSTAAVQLPSLGKTTSYSSTATDSRASIVIVTPCSDHPTGGCDTTIPISHTHIPFSPSASHPNSATANPLSCSDNAYMLCIGPATVGPTPCGNHQSKMCVGSVIIGPTPCASNSSQNCMGNVTIGTNITTSIQSTSMNSTTAPPLSTKTSAFSPPVNTTASATSRNVLNRRPPKVVLLVCMLLVLWPVFMFASLSMAFPTMRTMHALSS